MSNVVEVKARGAEVLALTTEDFREKMEKTADATIQVDPERSYLVEARIIDGRRYLLVPADESVEVNGLGVRIAAAKDGGETT